MILIGMFDSPFVRRVAISASLLGIPFEHRNWSVGRDAARIREYSPLGRVPTLVLDDGEVLTESSALLDYLDQTVGPARALLPPTGAERRKALQAMALATGAAEKCVTQVYERLFRPAEKVHQPWIDRCEAQVQGALGELERLCGPRADGAWLLGARLTQADITVVCCASFISEVRELSFAAAFPALHRLMLQAEALPAFGQFRVPFFAPKPAA